MIDGARQDEALAVDPQNNRELYERLRDHIGAVMMIRRQAVERTGILAYVSYNRDQKEIYFNLGKGETSELNTKHRVEVRLDGVWKVLCRGSSVNRKLT